MFFEIHPCCTIQWVHSFLWINTAPLQRVYCSILLYMFTSCWTLSIWIMLLWTFTFKSSCGLMFSLGHMVTFIFLFYKKNCLSKVARVLLRIQERGGLRKALQCVQVRAFVALRMRWSESRLEKVAAGIGAEEMDKNNWDNFVGIFVKGRREIPQQVERVIS